MTMNAPHTPTISTDNTETLHNALQKIGELESSLKEYRSKLETVEEALAGAHRIIRHLRDGDSRLPALTEKEH